MLPIRTKRLYITEFKESMAESAHLNSLDGDNRRFVPDEVFESVDEARKTLSALISYYSRKDAPLVYAVILNDGRHIGHVQAVPLADGWEIGYRIAKPFTGYGYATEAVNAFLPQIMRHIGISKIYGICRADNPASRKVLEKCGFLLEYEGAAPYHGAEYPICRYIHYDEFERLEKMDRFFDDRANTYDNHMLDDLGLNAFYEAVSACIDKPVTRLLDLGCGTGLELERLFQRFPDMEVTGIDMSAEMLKKLETKYQGRRLRLICGSYFDEDFGGPYDCVSSTFSLHHFDEDEKQGLYRKIHAALQMDGAFVFGDSTVSTPERQRELFEENTKRRREQEIPAEELYHFDTPLTPETEMRLLTAAGFMDVEIVRQWDNNILITAKKRDECVGSVYGDVRRDAEYMKNLIGFLRREYDIETIRIEHAKRGYYGETWKVDAAERRYFIKLDYSSRHKHIYERSFPVMERLQSHGIDFISRIIKTKSGDLSARFDGAVIGVFDWIYGENIQNERTKYAEYHMLARIYTVPTDGLPIPVEDFSDNSAELFFTQWDALDDKQIRLLLENNRAKLEQRAKRLKHFAALCRGDTVGYAITHGDVGGNVIMDGDNFYIVDWDDPILAPPERDAWFCLNWGWAMDIFNSELRKNGIDYTLRPERLAYYCYHSFFYYLTEYMSTYFDIGNRGGDMAQKLGDYFKCWIEDEIQYADKYL